MKFSIGDRVRIVKAINYPETIGTVCTVVSDLERGWGGDLRGHYMGYRVDLENPRKPGVGFIVPPEHLAPYYDGNELVSWSDCLWQPTPVSLGEHSNG